MACPPPPPPEALFHVFRDAVEGPFDRAALAGMARAGLIGPETRIHPQGGAWMPAGTHPDLAPLFRPPPPPP